MEAMLQDFRKCHRRCPIAFQFFQRPIRMHAQHGKSPIGQFQRVNRIHKHPCVVFGYGFLVPVEEGTVAPSMIIEVKNIDETVKKTEEFGGKLIKERFTVLGDDYAIIEDSEGNRYYLWDRPDNVPDYCIHGVKNTGAQ